MHHCFMMWTLPVSDDGSNYPFFAIASSCRRWHLIVVDVRFDAVPVHVRISQLLFDQLLHTQLSIMSIRLPHALQKNRIVFLLLLLLLFFHSNQCSMSIYINVCVLVFRSNHMQHLHQLISFTFFAIEQYALIVCIQF